MGGFGTAKSEEKQAAKPKSQADRFAELREELEHLKTIKPVSHVFCGLIGYENSAKTGVVVDALMSNQEAIDNGDMLWVLDFDGGASATRTGHYKNAENIRIWDPVVMQPNAVTAFDYPATHDRVLSIAQFALEHAKNQSRKGYEGPKIWGFLVTAVDVFDDICVANMKITDLGTAKDGIEAANPTKLVGNQWNWTLRSTRFHQLTYICKEMVKYGVNVFYETHLKEARDDKGNIIAGVEGPPVWEKTTPNHLNQIIRCRREEVLDDDGKLIATDFTAKVEKCKTNSTLQGYTETVLRTTTKDRKAEWKGFSPLRKMEL